MQKMTKELVSSLNNIAHAYIVDRNPAITKWEGEFAIDNYKRWEKFGEKTFCSEKQAAIINKIAAKLA